MTTPAVSRPPRIEVSGAPPAPGARSVPGAPSVPGLRFRRIDLDADVVGLAAVINDSAAADHAEYTLSTDDIRNDLEHQANFDIERDVLIAEIDSRIVGETEQSVVVREGVAVHQFNLWVHPDVRGRGIGRTLLRWTESRAREAAAEWSGSEPHELGVWVDSQMGGAIALLESSGYRRARYGFMMVRPLAEPIPTAVLPAGLEVARSPMPTTAGSGMLTPRRSRTTPTRQRARRRTSSAGSGCRISTRACGAWRGTVTRSRARS